MAASVDTPAVPDAPAVSEADKESEKAVETVYRLQKRFAKQYNKHLGTPIGRLNIPGMGLSTILVEGTDRWSSLTKGPGVTATPRFPGAAPPSASPATARRSPRRSATSTTSQGRQDHAEDAVRHLRLPRARPQDRQEQRLVDHQAGRPRAARAVGLPPALLGLAALGRVRRPRHDHVPGAPRPRPSDQVPPG